MREECLLRETDNFELKGSQYAVPGWSIVGFKVKPEEEGIDYQRCKLAATSELKLVDAIRRKQMNRWMPRLREKARLLND